MDHELAKIAQTIDLGELGIRIRAARIAAGLTQGDIAQGMVSAAYVSRIEAGQRRPEPKVLEHLANKLDLTLGELLEGTGSDRQSEMRLALDYAEFSLRAGSPADALARVADVLDRVDEGGAPVCRQATLVKAMALEATGAVDDAIREFEDLLEAEPRDVLWLRAAISLTRCYREQGDLPRAVDVGKAAADKVHELGLEGVDESVQLVVTLASVHFERGDVGHAVRLCARAIEQAEHLESPKAMASAYWNASVMESEQGRVESAVSLAQRAIALLESQDDGRNLARLHSQLGIYQLRLDPPQVDEAYENLERAGREMDWSSASPVDKSRNQLALGRALHLKGDEARAEDHAGACYELARESAPLLAVDALVLQGQIAATRGSKDEARARFQEAILALTGIGADRHAAQLWFELGALLEGVGEHAQALDAYKRGAVSTGFMPSETSRTRI